MKKIIMLFITVGFLSFNANAFATNTVEDNKTETKVVTFSKEVEFVQLTADRSNDMQNKADIEPCEKGGIPDKCCSYWNNKIDEKLEAFFPIFGGVWPVRYLEFSCETGGEYKCLLGKCGE